MEKIKKYFELEGRYKFDLMDLIAVANLVGVILTIIGAPMVGYVMLIIAFVGFVNSFRYHRFNLVVLNLAFLILDLYLVLV